MSEPNYVEMFFLFLMGLKMIPSYIRSTLTNGLQIDHLVVTRGHWWGWEMRFRVVTHEFKCWSLISYCRSILYCIFVSWTASGMIGIQMEISLFFSFLCCPRWRKAFWEISMDVLKLDAKSIMQRKFMETLCYLKFLYHSKQCDLFRGNCFGHYVDFSGDGSQSDLYHVAWVYDFSSIVSHLGRTLDPTL